MDESGARRCPDCGGEVQAIKLFARSPDSEADAAVIRFATAEAKLGIWFSRTYDVAGKVSAVLCSSCHRIILYGHPNEY